MTLTRREREIALVVAEGLTNKEIAQRLYISLPTVKSHVHSILRKLGVERRDQVFGQLRDLGRSRSIFDLKSIGPIDAGRLTQS